MDRERKKAINKIIGRSLRYNIVLLMYPIITTLYIVFNIVPSIQDAGYLESDEDSRILYILLGIHCLIVFVILIVLIHHLIIVHRCKEEFYEQSDYQQEEKIGLSTGYKILDRLKYNDEYVYGGMLKEFGFHKKLRYYVGIKFIEIRKISWIYVVETVVSMVNNDTGSVKLMPLPRNNFIRIYDSKGNQYRCDVGKSNVNALFNHIKKINPNCKIGFRK